MATLQGGERARMYALGKIARGGATRGGYVSGRVFVAIDGTHVGFGGAPGAAHVGTIIDSLTITDALNEAPNTCAFRVNGSIPAAGAEVRITLGSKNRVDPLFAGFALHVLQGYAANKPANINADLSCVDYTWLLGFVKVTAIYRSQSASAIAIDLVARFAAQNGFTARAVAPNLPKLDAITFTNEELDQALSRLAQRIGAYWYVDYQKDLHFFITENTNGDPEVLTPNHRSLADVRKTADRTQVLTRVYVEGRGTTILGAVAPGDTMIPLEAIDMFAIASDVFAKISPHGSGAGAQHVTFTGIVAGEAGSLVGPGVGPPGALTVGLAAGTGLGAGRYQYAYTDVTAAGETRPSPLAVIDVGAPLAPPTVPPTATPADAASGGIDVGTHNYAYTYLTPGGETTGSPLVPMNTLNPMSPTGGIYSYTPIVLGGSGMITNYTYGYLVTYRGNGGGETTAAQYGYMATTANGCNAIQLNVNYDARTQIPPGTIQVNFYRTRGAPAGSPNPTGPYLFTGSVAVPPGGTAVGHLVQFNDTTADGNLGAPIPTTNSAQAQLRQVTITTPAGPDPIISGVKIYRTPANTTLPYRLVAQVNGGQGAATYVDTTADASLGAEAPYVNTSGDGLRRVQVSNLAPGPSATTARYVYRTAANGSQLKFAGGFVDNTTTAYLDSLPDASLGANAPTSDTSGLQQVPGTVPAGASSIIVANPIPFEATGGWAIIGNGEQVIRYTGKTANALTGIPATGIGAIVAAIAYSSTITAAPMLVGVPASGAYAIAEALTPGDDLNFVVYRENAARQTDLANMVKGGPGIREEWIQDRRLGIPEARARGDATLALRPLEDVTITYSCRDLRTASGKTITVNLPAPTNISGSFKIQTVTIGNFRPYPTQYPTFRVEASSSQFSFEDWLRRMETKA